MKLPKFNPKWIIGIVGALVLLFVLSKRRPAQASGVSTPVTYTQADSGIMDAMNSVLKQVAGVQTGIAALSENQITSAAVQQQVLGASSWLTCCNPADWHCDASCFKQKGGSTANVLGSGSVTDLKTQNREQIAKYAAPFGSCLTGQNYDFGCVGSLIAGSPTYNRITDQDTTRSAPEIHPVGTGVI